MFELYRHKKRGTLYVVVDEVLNENRFSVEQKAYPNLHPNQNHADIVYASVSDGQRWVRPYKEFHDGRFERVVSTSSSEGAKAIADAWGIIANVSNGDWEQQPTAWRSAAMAWRDAYAADIPTHSKRIIQELRKGHTMNANAPKAAAPTAADLVSAQVKKTVAVAVQPQKSSASDLHAAFELLKEAMISNRLAKVTASLVDGKLRVESVEQPKAVTTEI